MNSILLQHFSWIALHHDGTSDGEGIYRRVRARVQWQSTAGMWRDCGGAGREAAGRCVWSTCALRAPFGCQRDFSQSSHRLCSEHAKATAPWRDSSIPVSPGCGVGSGCVLAHPSATWATSWHRHIRLYLDGTEEKGKGVSRAQPHRATWRELPGVHGTQWGGVWVMSRQTCRAEVHVAAGGRYGSGWGDFAYYVRVVK